MLLGGLDDPVKDRDIYWAQSVTNSFTNRVHSLSSVSGENSSALLCSSDSGDSGGIDSIDAYHASISDA